MKESQIESILANEVMLWEQYTKMEWVEKDVVRCELHDGIMPDGAPCRGLIKCKSRRDAATQWYNFVRGQYDARKNLQEAEAAKRAEASRASSNPPDSPAGEHGGSGVGSAPPVQDSEASVEELLQSKITSIGGLITGIERARQDAAGALAALDARLTTLKRDRAKAIIALKTMKATTHDSADAS